MNNLMICGTKTSIEDRPKIEEEEEEYE